jgi:hypothetical protein
MTEFCSAGAARHLSYAPKSIGTAGFLIEQMTRRLGG